MGMASITLNSGGGGNGSYGHTYKVFFLSNYILLGAASSCIFLTLSLRLLPSLCGFFVILLHVFTIAGAVSGCTAASSGTWRWYAAHMVTTVLTAIFQGSVSVLVFTTTDNFLGSLKSYVREDDASIILKMAGGLGVLIFCLEWIVLTLAFFLKYYTYAEGEGGARRTAKVQEENPKDWPWPFQLGGLGVLIFCLEWIVLTLAFFLKYYTYAEGEGGARRTAKVQEENPKDWPWPFQV